MQDFFKDIDMEWDIEMLPMRVDHAQTGRVVILYGYMRRHNKTE